MRITILLPLLVAGCAVSRPTSMPVPPTPRVQVSASRPGVRKGVPKPPRAEKKAPVKDQSKSSKEKVSSQEDLSKNSPSVKHFREVLAKAEAKVKQELGLSGSGGPGTSISNPGSSPSTRSSRSRIREAISRLQDRAKRMRDRLWETYRKTGRIDERLVRELVLIEESIATYQEILWASPSTPVFETSSKSQAR